MVEFASIPRPGSAAQYYRSIRLLHEGFGVPVNTIARLFQTGRPNIRQTESREYEDVPTFLVPPITGLLKEYSDERQWDLLRKKSRIESPLRNSRSLDAFEREIEKTFSIYSRSENFLAGERALRLYIPFVARASNPKMLRLRAIVFQNPAWMLTHAGNARRSIEYAFEAMHCASLAFDASLGDRAFLKQYHQSALIASNALLKSRQPDAAMSVLDQADAAVLVREGRLGSEHYHQRAVGHFQKGEDEAAKEELEKARVEVERVGYSDFIQVRMASQRQLNVIEPSSGIPRAFNLIHQAAKFYGQGSLEHTMAINWAAGSVLATDSQEDLKQASSIISSIDPLKRGFGHQATTRFLLSITPALNLSKAARNRWIRFLFYENAFRMK